MNAIQTTHKLDFESRPWTPSIKAFGINPNNTQEFRVGTITGQWFFSPKTRTLCILSIVNEKPGNGHLDDVFMWFEYSAKTHKCPLVIMEFMNDRFKKHCIEKRGFIPMPGTDHLVKIFD